MLERHVSKICRSPAGRIALAYAAISVVWILTSDRAAEVLAPGLVLLHSVKGLAFILLTSVALYILIHREMAGRVASELGRAEAERLMQEAETAKRQLAEVNSQLAKARDEAEAATQAKSRFLAAASHDMRQPLHVLSLLASALERRVAGEEATALVGNMRSAIRTMQGMFDTLLDVSRIDAGVMVPQVADFDLGLTLNKMANEFSVPAGQKGLELRIVPTRRFVRTDPNLLEGVLRNLLGNAIKFTARGRVLLGCRLQGQSLRIEVHDTGPGIPESHLETIFSEFQRFHTAEEPWERGLGLGLSIVRRIAGLLAHPLAVRSALGRGSTFSITVPLGRRRAAEARGVGRNNGSTRLDGRCILVVDDDAMVLAALARELSDLGAHVVPATSEDAALAACRKQGSIPDAAVVDLDLGVGGCGFSLTRRLGETVRGSLPIVYVTGSTDAETMRRLRAQPHPWMTKPVSPEALAHRLFADARSGPVPTLRPSSLHLGDEPGGNGDRL